MKTVLLLDDDKDLRTLLSPALLAKGLEVIEAAQGREADDILDKRPVDVIVVDGLLPDGPGVEFIERLRRRDRDTRVVFLSAFFRDLKTFKRQTSDLDVSLVLYKPVEPERIAAKIFELAEPPLPEIRTTAPPETTAPPLVLPAMAELRLEFAKKLPAKLDELDGALQAARGDLGRLGDARTLAHRLRGTAGSYGYPAVGDAVGLIEDRVSGALPTVSKNRLFWEEIEGAVQAARRAAARAPEQASSVEVSGALSKALLVVDDDPGFLQMVTALARKALIEVLSAQSADEALELARAQLLIGAILDVHIHGDESFLLARRIRDTEGNGEIPIAFVSADGRIETRVAAVEAGGTRFFDKPISEESFGELVQHFLHLSWSRQGSVLIVDDDQDVVAQYAGRLRLAGYVVDELTTADALVDRLEVAHPDVLLLDVNLPRVSGIDICRALRMSERWEFLPILIFTARLDMETRLRAFRAGASDVVGKPILPEELLARVGAQEERVRLLRDRADKDPLSGLMLRRAFTEAFQRALAACVRERRPLSLVLFDLDHFKLVNDTYGHLAGDRVIAGFGALLRRRFRVEDLRVRWGGEEFILVFPGQGVDLATQSASRLLREFGDLRFSGDEQQTFGATFTAGVSSYPDDGTSLSSLIRRADELMYAGKVAGRSVVQAGTQPLRGGLGTDGATARQEPR
jgi:diguanylate cyclase (GGDEF)-like protein